MLQAHKVPVEEEEATPDEVVNILTLQVRKKTRGANGDE